MASPLLIFNPDQGSDGYAASGAGPVNPVSGSHAYTDHDADTVGFLPADSVDLSLVATDGSHVAVIERDTSPARNFFSIIGKESTQLDTTGVATASSDNVTGIGSLAGVTVGRLALLEGAGAAGADLIVSVRAIISSNQIQLWQTVSTSQNPCTIHFLKGIKLGENLATGKGPLQFAIGGKRLSPPSTPQLFTDLIAGWQVKFESGTYDFADADLILPSDGIDYFGSGFSKPRFKMDGGAQIRMRGTDCRFRSIAFDLDVSLPGILVDSDNVRNLTLDKMVFKGNGSKSVKYTSAVTGGKLTVTRSKFSTCNLPRIEGILEQVIAKGIFAYDPSGTCYGFIFTKRGSIVLTDSVMDFLVTAVDLGSEAGAMASSYIANVWLQRARNTCIRAGHLDRVRGIVIIDSILYAETYQLDMPSGTDTVKGIIDYNRYVYANHLNNVSLGEHDSLTLSLQDPTPQTVGDDYRPSDLLYEGQGFLSELEESGTLFDNPIGIHRKKTPGGSILVRILSAIPSLGTSWEITYQILTGEKKGQVDSVKVGPGASPDPNMIVGAIGSYLKKTAGDAVGLVGMEINC